MTVAHPADFAGASFRAELEERGIRVVGRTRRVDEAHESAVGRLSAPGLGRRGPRILAEHVSHPLSDYLEVAKDPQAWANDYLVQVPDETGKEWPMVGSPVHLSKSPAQFPKQAPEFGQHTEEVLADLGYPWDDIEAFRAQRGL